jgi:hypothetical protein
MNEATDQENVYDKIVRFETETVTQLIEMERQLQVGMHGFVSQADIFTACAHRALRKGGAKMWPDLPVRVRRIEELADYVRYRYLPFKRVPWWRRLLTRFGVLPMGGVNGQDSDVPPNANQS